MWNIAHVHDEIVNNSMRKERSGQARWERADESMGPKRVTEGKEWGCRVDVTLG